MLHPNWWCSFGFYDENDDMRKWVDDMRLENQWESMGTSLQEATSWSLLPSGTHIQPVFLFEFFLIIKH